MKSTTTVRELTDMTLDRPRWVETVQDQGLLIAHLRDLKLLTGRKMQHIITAVWKTEGSLKEETVKHLEEIADAYPHKQKYDAFITSLTTIQRMLADKTPNKISALDEFRGLLNTTIFEIIKDPYKDVTLNRERLSSDSIAIAKEIYLDRSWELMPHLRDSLIDDGLQESDAHDGEILNHLLFPSENHTRGCWCLDMILGYE